MTSLSPFHGFLTAAVHETDALAGRFCLERAYHHGISADLIAGTCFMKQPNWWTSTDTQAWPVTINAFMKNDDDKNVFVLHHLLQNSQSARFQQWVTSSNVVEALNAFQVPAWGAALKEQLCPRGWNEWTCDAPLATGKEYLALKLGQHQNFSWLKIWGKTFPWAKTSDALTLFLTGSLLQFVKSSKVKPETLFSFQSTSWFKKVSPHWTLRFSKASSVVPWGCPDVAHWSHTSLASSFVYPKGWTLKHNTAPLLAYTNAVAPKDANATPLVLPLSHLVFSGWLESQSRGFKGSMPWQQWWGNAPPEDNLSRLPWHVIHEYDNGKDFLNSLHKIEFPICVERSSHFSLWQALGYALVKNYKFLSETHLNSFPFHFLKSSSPEQQQILLQEMWEGWCSFPMGSDFPNVMHRSHYRSDHGEQHSTQQRAWALLLELPWPPLIHDWFLGVSHMMLSQDPISAVQWEKVMLSRPAWPPADLPVFLTPKHRL